MEEELDISGEISDNDTTEYELDYLPDLTPIQERQIEDIPDILDKIDALLKILKIPDDLEPDISHMEPFQREEEVQYLYDNILEDCQSSGILNAACSADLLYFLHPEHNPPF